MPKTGRLAGEDQRFVSDAPPPEPPTSLGPAEVELWRRVTLALPPDWFSAENLPLLAAYCRHCVYADAIAADITAVRAGLAELAGSLPATYQVTAPAAAEKAKLIAGLQRELRALQRTHASESGAMLAVATKLRLTQQSRFQANSAQARTRGRPPVDSPRPWDSPDGQLEQ
jgi:hypothetical protein